MLRPLIDMQVMSALYVLGDFMRNISHGVKAKKVEHMLGWQVDVSSISDVFLIIRETERKGPTGLRL